MNANESDFLKPRTAGDRLVPYCSQHPHSHDQHGRQGLYPASKSRSLHPGLCAVCALHVHEGARLQNRACRFWWVAFRLIERVLPSVLPVLLTRCTFVLLLLISSKHLGLYFFRPVHAHASVCSHTHAHTHIRAHTHRRLPRP